MWRGFLMVKKKVAKKKAEPKILTPKDMRRFSTISNSMENLVSWKRRRFIAALIALYID